ncbi:hypothetical protein AVEN_189365-1 [Araneus ventricosus]|uniref:Uncharacterized protein n=1 Tax=Araneus ventricosus TaxID=182803 RepID=A0A4Y2N5H4_ARAVE|nr:hypothetical protein AVEN_189365-1 [Araneus ventricosus]
MHSFFVIQHAPSLHSSSSQICCMFLSILAMAVIIWAFKSEIVVGHRIFYKPLQKEITDGNLGTLADMVTVLYLCQLRDQSICGLHVIKVVPPCSTTSMIESPSHSCYC